MNYSGHDIDVIFYDDPEYQELLPERWAGAFASEPTRPCAMCGASKPLMVAQPRGNRGLRCKTCGLTVELERDKFSGIEKLIDAWNRLQESLEISKRG